MLILIMFLSITNIRMIWTQKNLMFRFYNSTQKKWELDYEEKGGLNVADYEQITSICNAFPSKWDVIEVDQYLNIEDKNKKKLYEWDYFKFDGGNIIYLACWDEKEKKDVYKPVLVPSQVKIDVRELVSPLFEIIWNIHEGINEEYYDFMKLYSEWKMPSEFYKFLDS